MQFKNWKSESAVFYIACGICALLIRLYWIAHDPTLSRDSITYLYWAQQWHAAQGMAGVLKIWPECGIPPLYLWMLQNAWQWGISPEWWGRMLSLSCGIAFIFVVAGIGHRLELPKAVTRGAVLLACFQPSLIELSTQVQRDSLYLFLLSFALYAGIRAWSQSIRPWGLLAGICAGTGMIIRYETAEFAVLWGGLSLFFIVTQRTTWKCASIQSVFMLSGILLTLGSYGIFGPSGSLPIYWNALLSKVGYIV